MLAAKEAERIQPVKDVEPIVNKIRKAYAAYRFAAAVRVKMKELRSKTDSGAKPGLDSGRSDEAPRVVAKIDML